MAEERVAEATGLRSLAGPARARVTDRAGWVKANIASFQRLLRPITDRLDEQHDRPRRSRRWPAGWPAPRSGRCSAGCRAGCSASTTCWSSRTRTPTTRTSCTTSGPNIIGLEKRFAFPPREFRLWLALHEVTHRAQFTGIPWMRQHFLGLVNQTVQAVDPDPEAVPRRARPPGRGPEGRTQAARRRRDHGGARDTRAARGAGSGERPDEPARGPRRRHDGSRRRRPHPERRPLRPGAAPAAPAGQPGGPAAAAADRPRGQDEAVRAGRAVHRGGRARRRPRAARPGLGGARPTCRRIAEIRDPAAWIARVGGASRPALAAG